VLKETKLLSQSVKRCFFRSITKKRKEKTLRALKLETFSEEITISNSVALEDAAKSKDFVLR